MAKKIILGVLLAGLVGLLVWGGINRTQARSADASRGGQADAQRSADNQGQGLPDSGNGAGQGGQPGNQGGYAASGGNPQAEVTEWVTLQGVIQSVSEDAAVIAASTGEVITLEGRAWSFAQEASFSMQAGDTVSLAGFYEGDDFEIGYVENLTSGQAIQLREQSGRPMWAGQGRGG